MRQQRYGRLLGWLDGMVADPIELLVLHTRPIRCG
jgi:hypothetical protein